MLIRRKVAELNYDLSFVLAHTDVMIENEEESKKNDKKIRKQKNIFMSVACWLKTKPQSPDNVQTNFHGWSI